MTMQAEHLDDELLQRHYDGDLAGEEAARADAHLRDCEVCTGKQAVLSRLSSLIAQSASEHAASVDFGDMFERIEHGVAREATGARVVSMSGRRKRPVAAFSAVLAGLAAAAAVVLMVYRPGGDKALPEEPVAAGGAPSGAQHAAPAPTAANPPGRSEVVQVDFGSNAGTVFDIPLSDGSSTPVVWINDDE